MDITKIAPEEEGSEGTGEKEEVHALQPNEAVQAEEKQAGEVEGDPLPQSSSNPQQIEEQLPIEAKVDNPFRQQQRQQSFTDLKQSNQDTQNQSEKCQILNRYQASSHDELISITETTHILTNGLLSSDMLFQQQQEVKVQRQPRGEEEMNLVESTPFQIMQESVVASESRGYTLEETQNLFIQTHTEEINLEQSLSAKKQQERSEERQEEDEMSRRVQASIELHLSQRKSKLKIEKAIEVSHFSQPLPPKIQESQAKVEIIQPNPQAVSEVPQEAQTQKAVVEPLKIESLFISSLRSKTEIKPPEATSEKKPKPWEKFKIKKPANEPIGTDPSTEPIKSEVVTNPLLSVNPTIAKENAVAQPMAQTSSTEPIHQVPQKSIQPSTITRVNEGSAKIEEVPPLQQIELEKPNVVPSLAEHEIKQLPQKSAEVIGGKAHPLPSENQLKPKNDGIQFHNAYHHPLQHPPALIKQTQLQPIDNQQEENPIPPALVPQQPLPLIKEQSLPNQIPPENAPSNYIQESESSISEKENIDIDYSRNKKYQEQLNRERIKQLEEKLRKQLELNQQLHKVISLPLRLLLSLTTGATIGGIAWLVKKKKIMAALIGFATSMSVLIVSG